MELDSDTKQKIKDNPRAIMGILDLTLSREIRQRDLVKNREEMTKLEIQKERDFLQKLDSDIMFWCYTAKISEYGFFNRDYREAVKKELKINKRL